MYNLYLKTHNKTNLKYLGYTKREDYDVYKGSGIYWKRHIKKYGYDVETELLGSFDDLAKLKQHGTHFSILWNVVDSNDFANLKTEEGISGNYGDETRRKMSENHNYDTKRWDNCARKIQSILTTKRNKKLWADPEHKIKRSLSISKSLKGKPSLYIGIPRSKEVCEKISKTLMGRQGAKYNMKLVICPHCKLEGKGGNMKRYHFDNCKTLKGSNL
jgi:hypothetical protein|tara:strand:+ start:162 stop:809 length:648 start_codon:yes stop_codon:yes gene_type:complete